MSASYEHLIQGVAEASKDQRPFELTKQVA